MFNKKLTVGFLIALLIVVTGAGAFGQTRTGNVNLSGTVAAIFELTVTPEPTNASLPLTENKADLLIATVNERSNKRAGYTVTISTSNFDAGTNKPVFFSAGAAESLPFDIKYDGVAVSFSGGSAPLTDKVGKTGAGGLTKPLTISYSGASYFLDEGVYTNALTLTMTAK